MSEPLTCQKVVIEGAFGSSVDDETPNMMCPNAATWRIERDGARPRVRCDEHTAEFRALPLDGIRFVPLPEEISR